MQKFTDVYNKARNVFETQTFEAGWQEFLSKKCNAKTLLGPKGFSTSNAKAPERIREKIKENTKPGMSTSGTVIYDAAKNDKSLGTLAERAAALKMLRHVYRLIKKGEQDVWIYAPPKDYGTWVFDEIKGDAASLKARLAKDEEIFSQKEMEWMSAALTVALKVSEDTRVKLSSKPEAGGKDATAEIVKRWFLDEDCGDEQQKDAIAKLSAGFRNISVACMSSQLVFTDYADWRAQRNKFYGAAFRGGEGGGFPVIYLEGAFTRLTGNTGKQWLCAQTIIHEFSHHELKTHDHRYDNHGLKPNKSSFTYAQAIENADSWGYFALDLAGYLSKADRDKTWK